MSQGNHYLLGWTGGGLLALTALLPLSGGQWAFKVAAAITGGSTSALLYCCFGIGFACTALAIASLIGRGLNVTAKAYRLDSIWHSARGHWSCQATVYALALLQALQGSCYAYKGWQAISQLAPPAAATAGVATLLALLPHLGASAGIMTWWHARENEAPGAAHLFSGLIGSVVLLAICSLAQTVGLISALALAAAIALMAGLWVIATGPALTEEVSSDSSAAESAIMEYQEVTWQPGEDETRQQKQPAKK